MERKGSDQRNARKTAHKKYKEIDSNFRMLRKVSNIEDAKILVDEIWNIKSFANDIELELMRREYTNGT